MTYDVHVRRNAERDIVRASEWYESEAPEQVQRFRDQLRVAVQKAAARPLVTKAIQDDARRIHLDVFPYEIWFLVDEQLERIEVIALVHDREDPRAKRARLGPSE